MPSVSGKQHRAMAAAASGHSTLGIPSDVGAEFLHADKGKTFSDHMKSRGYAKGAHKRHPASGHTSAFGSEGNKFRKRG